MMMMMMMMMMMIINYTLNASTSLQRKFEIQPYVVASHEKLRQRDELSVQFKRELKSPTIVSYQTKQTEIAVRS